MQRLAGILSLIGGLIALAAALFTGRFQLLSVGVAVIFFFIGGTSLSRANQIRKAIKPLVRKSVRVEVWGRPLPVSGETSFEIDSVSAFGAGLLVHLREASGGRRFLLKVAQPGAAKMEQGRIEIAEAAYVSWAGTKLQPAGGTKVPALVLFTAP